MNESKNWLQVMDERLEKLECYMDMEDRVIVASVLMRLSDLEEWTRKDEDKIYSRLKELQGEITELKRFQDITHLQYQRNISGNKPHKCPVCEGLRFLWDITDNNNAPFQNSKKIDCYTCEGEGIVWG